MSNKKCPMDDQLSSRVGRTFGRDKRVSGHQGPIHIITWLNLVLSYQSMMIYNILVRTYEMCSPSEA
jgi:hypothetical protein